MEAHSLSSQYLLVADDSHSSQIPSVGREGDFATAQRAERCDGSKSDLQPVRHRLPGLRHNPVTGA
jgi:hypothetical protein